MLHKWKILHSEWALDTKWFPVRKDTVEVAPGKVIDDYFVGVFPAIVMIVALTSEGEVALVRQYKHAVGDIIMELPAGAVDKGEDVTEAAKRELLEETGFATSSWEKIGEFHRSPAKAEGNILHVYVATGAHKVGDQKLDELENIEVLMMPYTEALAMAKGGKIYASDTALALLLAEGKIKY